MKRTALKRWAIIGDVIVLASLTLVGFATHGTLGNIGRVLVTLTAFLVAWAAAAPWLASYRDDTIVDVRSVWKPFWAWMLAAPFGAALRALVLDIAITPVFVFVSIAVNGAGLIVWRLLLAGWARRAMGAD